MSSSKKRVTLNTVSVKLGCSSSCRRPKLSNIFSPKPRKQHRPSSSSSYKKKPTNSSYFSSSYSWDNNTPTTFSSVLEEPTPANYSSSDSDSSATRAVSGFGKIDGQSVAVEKDSEDPYLDFRQSMLQMIIERNINTKHDLKELLNCFLQLNSPYYHGVIVRAFMEICNGQYPAAATKPASPLLHGGRWSSRDY